MPPPKPKRRLLVGPAGLQKWADPAELKKHGLPEGFELAGAQAEAAAVRGEMFGGPAGAASAALIGGARGITLGGLDYAMVKGAEALHGEKGAEDMRAVLTGLREEHPAATIGGEVGSLLLGGAAGKGAKLGVKAMAATPLRGAVRAGELAEAGVLALRPGSKLLAGAARAGTEGAIFGAGHAVSESALTGVDLTGEQLAASVAIGGGAGAVMGGALVGGGKLLGAIAKPGRKAHERVAGTLFGNEAGGGKLAEAYGWASSVASSAKKGDVKGLMRAGEKGATLRAKAVYEADDIIEASAKSIQRHGDELLDGQSFAYQLSTKLKPKAFAPLVAKGNDAIIIAQSKAHARELGTLVRTLRDNPAEFGKAGMSSFEGQASALVNKLDDVVARGGKGMAPEVRTINDNIKRLLDKFDKRWGNMGRSGAYEGSLAMQAASEARLVANQYRSFLERADVWGEAGTVQAVWNKATGDGLSYRGKFDQGLVTKAGRDKYDPMQTRRVMDDKKVKAHLASLTNPEESVVHKSLLEQAKAAEDGATVALEKLGAGLSNADRAALTKMRDAAKAIRTESAKSTDAIAASAQLKAVEAAQSKGPGAVLGGLAAAGVGGYGIAEGNTGAIGAGLLLAALTRPGMVIRQLAAAERLAGDLGAKRAAGLEKLFSRARAGAARAGALAVSGEGAATQFESRAAQLRANSPEATSDETKRALGAVSTTQPEAIAAAGAAAARRQAYQQSLLPAELSTFALGDAPQLSNMELDDVLRKIRISDDPTKILDELDKGTLDRGAIEAMKRTSPAMFRQLQRDAMDHMLDMSAEGKMLPYADRLQLDTLLELGVEPTLDPELMMQMQSLYQAPIAGPGQAGPPPGKTDMPDLATGMQTNPQRVAAAREEG